MPNNLPGDFTKEEKIARMLRVNHAGEYGAKRIYAGQMRVLKNTQSAAVIAHMAEQEEVHLKAFSDELLRRKQRPTLLMPLWHVGAYAMGAATALFGEKAAMACTVAVESVIDEHYAQQEKELADEPELQTMIKKFRADEKEHHDTALAHDAEQSPFYSVLTTAVKAHTKMAIWFSTRI